MTPAIIFTLNLLRNFNHVCILELKNSSELTFTTSNDHLFDEHFDLEEFMFPQNSESDPSQLQTAHDNTYTTAKETDEEKPESFTVSQLVSANVNLNEFCDANFNAQENPMKSISNDFQSLSNSRHCSYSNIYNDAFIEDFDSSPPSSHYNSIIPQQNLTNSSFYAKRGDNDPYVSAIPENNFPSLNSNSFSNSFNDPKYIASGAFLDSKSCLAVGQWQENNTLHVCPSLCGEAENDEMGLSSNISSDSRTESHDTDITDPAESRKQSTQQSCSDLGSMESKSSSSKKTAYNEKWGVKVFRGIIQLDETL